MALASILQLRRLRRGRLFSHLDLRVGTADKLDFPDQSLDFILFGFCLYLVDQEHITVW